MSEAKLGGPVPRWCYFLSGVSFISKLKYLGVSGPGVEHLMSREYCRPGDRRTMGHCFRRRIYVRAEDYGVLLQRWGIQHIHGLLDVRSSDIVGISRASHASSQCNRNIKSVCHCDCMSLPRSIACKATIISKHKEGVCTASSSPKRPIPPRTPSSTPHPLSESVS